MFGVIWDGRHHCRSECKETDVKTICIKDTENGNWEVGEKYCNDGNSFTTDCPDNDNIVYLCCVNDNNVLYNHRDTGSVGCGLGRTYSRNACQINEIGRSVELANGKWQLIGILDQDEGEDIKDEDTKACFKVGNRFRTVSYKEGTSTINIGLLYSKGECGEIEGSDATLCVPPYGDNITCSIQKPRVRKVDVVIKPDKNLKVPCNTDMSNNNDTCVCIHEMNVFIEELKTDNTVESRTINVNHEYYIGANGYCEKANAFDQMMCAREAANVNATSFQYNSTNGECTVAIGNKNRSSIIRFKYWFSSYAQSVSNTSQIENSNDLIKGVNGEYLFEYEGKYYLFNYADGVTSVEADTDGDGKVDKTFSMSELINLKVENISIARTFNLRKGFNLVHIDVYNTQYSPFTANDLYLKLKNKGVSLVRIAKFDGTWSQMVGDTESGRTAENINFKLLPGFGYLVYVSQDIDITLNGNEVTFNSTTGQSPINLSPGWNLIGLYGTEVKDYTAETLIDSINKYEKVDFTVNNVSDFVSDRQLYRGLQKEVDDKGKTQVYGFDYKLNKQTGYFVRVVSGKGTYQPEAK